MSQNWAITFLSYSFLQYFLQVICVLSPICWALLVAQFSSVQMLSYVQLFVTPWTAGLQASQLQEFTQTLIHWVSDAIQPSHPLLPLFLPPSIIRVFSNMSQFFASGGQSIGVSASTSVLSMNIQHRFPLRLAGWISLQSKGLSRVFSNTTVQKHQFSGAQLSL